MEIKYTLLLVNQPRCSYKIIFLLLGLVFFKVKLGRGSNEANRVFTIASDLSKHLLMIPVYLMMHGNGIIFATPHLGMHISLAHAEPLVKKYSLVGNTSSL